VAQLIVRDLSEDLVKALKQRAAKRNRSTEQEHREILQSVLRVPRGNTWQTFLRLFQRRRGQRFQTRAVRQTRLICTCLIRTSLVRSEKATRPTLVSGPFSRTRVASQSIFICR